MPRPPIPRRPQPPGQAPAAPRPYTPPGAQVSQEIRPGGLDRAMALAVPRGCRPKR